MLTDRGQLAKSPPCGRLLKDKRGSMASAPSRAFTAGTRCRPERSPEDLFVATKELQHVTPGNDVLLLDHPLEQLTRLAGTHPRDELHLGGLPGGVGGQVDVNAHLQGRTNCAL